MLTLYYKNHLEKGYTSIGLFREIKKVFSPGRVLYPGCYVHITPSLIFSDATYIDSFRNTDKFYASPEVKKFINTNKEYTEDSKIVFYHQDYSKDIHEDLESFDIVISQYGGFVGLAVKKYLKRSGFLVCNNSHGDASMASVDPDFKLVSVYNRRSDEKFSISSRNLNQYLIPKKATIITRKILEKRMKGIAYTKSPSGYIFQKS